MYLSLMVAFDQELWRSRARERMERAVAREPRKAKKLEVQYSKELVAITGLSKLIDWCNERSLVVGFTRGINGGTYDPETNVIEVVGNARPETQLHFLLHECGHYLVDKCGDKRIRRAAAAIEGARSLVGKVDIINEEFEAWNRGRKLAKRQRISINNANFEVQRARALSSYFYWATGR
jgi:hypothetical protein